jgi:hypothetical protein
VLPSTIGEIRQDRSHFYGIDFLYWPLGTLVITGPKALDFYGGFCAHRATYLKADGKDIMDLKLILNGGSNAENEVGPPKVSR